MSLLRYLLPALALLPLTSGADAAGLYGFTDDAGVAHFSDVADDRRYRRIPVIGGESGAAPRRRAVLPSAGLHAQISRIAMEHGIAPALALALIEVESGFRTDARSPKGALGLMQLMPATAARYGVADPLDAADNLRGGMRYLCDLFARFGAPELALAAYNAGEGAVIKYGNDIPPYAETQSYVPRVMARHAELSRQTGMGGQGRGAVSGSCMR